MLKKTSAYFLLYDTTELFFVGQDHLATVAFNIVAASLAAR